jgi:hypothetical protein
MKPVIGQIITFVTPLTLGSWVKPEMFHSLTSGGASTDVSLAASANGSLIKFTTNCFVARMLSRVFLG